MKGMLVPLNKVKTGHNLQYIKVSLLTFEFNIVLIPKETRNKQIDMQNMKTHVSHLN